MNSGLEDKVMWSKIRLRKSARLEKSWEDQDCGFCFLVTLAVILSVRLEGTLNDPPSPRTLFTGNQGLDNSSVRAKFETHGYISELRNLKGTQPSDEGAKLHLNGLRRTMFDA